MRIVNHMNYWAFWPHALVMVPLGAFALRSSVEGKWALGAGFTVLASIALTILYRVLPSGIAPPMREEIGLPGWIATIITASVPLLTVLATAFVCNRFEFSAATRLVFAAAAGLVALVAYPLYGMLLYCSFTRICP